MCGASGHLCFGLVALLVFLLPQVVSSVNCSNFKLKIGICACAVCKPLAMVLRDAKGEIVKGKGKGRGGGGKGKGKSAAEEAVAKGKGRSAVGKPTAGLLREWQQSSQWQGGWDNYRRAARDDLDFIIEYEFPY